MVTSIINSVIGGSSAKSAASQQAAAAAAATQAETTNAEAANKIQQDEYNQTRQDVLANQATNTANYQPFLQTGTSANKQLGYALGLGGTGTGESGALAKPFTMADFQQDPGYQFQLSEGQKALDRVSSAKGKYYSGGAIKDLTAYNQGMANTDYQNAYNNYNTNQTNLYNRLAGVSTSGQNAAAGIANIGAQTEAQLNNAGQSYANQSGANLTGLGKEIGANNITAGNAQSAGTLGQAQAWQTGLSAPQNQAYKLIGAIGGAGGF